MEIGENYIGDLPQIYYLKGVNYFLQNFYKEAIFYLKEAEKLGNQEATNLLGNIYYLKEQYKEAIKCYEKVANQGNLEAMYKLGHLCYILFLKGDNDSLDYQKKALKNCLNAASAGYAPAQTIIGAIMYHKKQYLEAKNWLIKAINADEGMAFYFLGLLYFNGYGVKKNLEVAKKYFELAKNLGYNQ